MMKRNNRTMVCLLMLILLGGCVDGLDYINAYVFDTAAADDCLYLAADLLPGAMVEFTEEGPVLLVNGEVVPVPESPADIGLTYEAFKVLNDRQEVISGWMITPDGEPRNAIMLSGGSVGTKACYLPWAQWLTAAGNTVVLYDYTGFGESPGEKNLERIVPDAQAVFTWMLNQAPGVEQGVVLYGISLGTGPSIELAGRFPQKISAVVVDSPYTAESRVARLELDGFFVALIRTLLGAFPAEMDNELNIGAVNQPLLMLYGTLDTIEAGRGLFDLAPGGVDLVEFPFGHIEAAFHDPARYQEAVLGFLDEYVVATPDQVN
ncbi:MAG: hypothetical protein HJJLKODD_02194 [Phycisphaerae bacterium]|nr:hypothetical protein [Phycisphaerae bacterium]